MDKNIIDRLQDQVKDEQEAVELYTKLADEVDNKGLYRRALLIRNIAADEKRHKQILEETIEEVQTIGALIGAAAKAGPVYWWVRIGNVVKYEKFVTLDEAKKYVEAATGEPFSEAHWINAYGFELGPYKGPNFISFLEADEDGVPTERHLYGKVD